MILALNLIPPAYQDRFRLQRVFALLRNVIVAVILYTILLAMVVLVARYLLQINFNRITDETTLVTKTNRDLEQKITAFNRDIAVAKSIQQNAQPWAELLVALADVTPPEVTLTSFTLATGNDQSSVTGLAATRSDLLQFKERLDHTAYLSAVTLPVTALLARENVPFTITFSLNLDKVPLRPRL